MLGADQEQKPVISVLAREGRTGLEPTAATDFGGHPSAARLGRGTLPPVQSEVRWHSVAIYPVLTILALLVISVSGPLLSSFVYGWAAILVVSIICIFGAVRIGKVHRCAFMARERSRGVSERDALRAYDERYST
jgi:hypothetical protein